MSDSVKEMKQSILDDVEAWTSTEMASRSFRVRFAAFLLDVELSNFAKAADCVAREESGIEAVAAAVAFKASTSAKMALDESREEILFVADTLSAAVDSRAYVRDALLSIGVSMNDCAARQSSDESDSN